MVGFFEQPSDIANERAILDKVESLNGVKIIKSERGAPYDGYIEDKGVITSIFEVKRRKLTLEKAWGYGSIYMNKAKYDKCVSISRELKATFHFVVQLDDALLHFWLPHSDPSPDYREAFNKTSQGRDPSDNAMMVHIPIEDFRKVD